MISKICLDSLDLSHGAGSCDLSKKRTARKARAPTQAPPKKIPKNPSLKNEQFEKSDSYARVEKPLTACKWVAQSPREQKKIKKCFQS